MPWYVLYTNPKAEKKVAQQIAAMGYEVYCPLIQQVRQWSDRKKTVEVPLFNSYVFVNIEDSERHKVFDAKGVVRFLFWLGRPAVVKDEEIEEIKKWLNSQSVEFEIESLHEGDFVEIKEGQFKGHSGIVQYINKNYVRIVIESIGFVLVVKSKKDLDTA